MVAAGISLLSAATLCSLFAVTDHVHVFLHSDLEKYVKCLQNPAHSPAQLSVTLTDMEEAAMDLRRAEEDLAVLRGGQSAGV